jgi:VWFA-related protein
MAILITRVCPIALPALNGQAAPAAITQSDVSSPQTSQPPYALRLKARLVVLDVVVTNRAGKSVDGLTAQDFRIVEEGQPQRIRSFEPSSVHTLPQTAAEAGASAVFDPAQPASFGYAPVTILVLDQLNTHFADSSFARNSLRDYLAGQPALLSQPATLLTVYDNHFKLLQPFTRDRDALLRALAAAPVKFAWKLEINGKTDYGPVERLDQSLRALEEIAQSYARIPGRKNVVWVGGGFPTIDPSTIDGDDALEVKGALEHLTDVLLDARVTLYAVDPASNAAGMTEVTDTTQMDFLEAAGDGLSGNFDPFGASEDFDRIGPVTGGRVVRGRNDVARQIAAAIDLGAHYYTLAYTPSSASEAAAQFRKIRVLCLRPGLTVSTRGGYYAGNESEEASPATAAYDLTTAAETAIPLNGVRVRVEAPPAGQSSASAYLVHAGAANLTWKPNVDGSSSASVYIMAVSLDAKGRMLGHTLHGMTAHAKPGSNLTDPTKTADFAFPVQPMPRATTLRFVVRDRPSGRMGSFDLPLTARSAQSAPAAP